MGCGFKSGWPVRVSVRVRVGVRAGVGTRLTLSSGAA